LVGVAIEMLQPFEIFLPFIEAGGRIQYDIYHEKMQSYVKFNKLKINSLIEELIDLDLTSTAM